MKLWKKALSLALCLCLVLSLMPALAPVEAEAASVPTYISGIYFAADKNQSTAKNAVKNAGYTLIDYDLNKGCGASSKYIYMGYKTTSDPSQAITGIFFSDDIKNPAASYTFPYNGKQITANKVSDVDLNSGASGDYIFAYTTTDLNFGNPVTTIQIKGNNSINAAEADGTWTIGRQIASGALYGTDGRNLNAATLGDKIYLHYKQAKALEAKAYFYQMGAQDAVSTVCTSYSGTVYDNYNTIEAKPQILQEVSLGGVTYRFAGWREDTNGYVVTTTKPQMGADKVRYYYAIYDFDITVTFDSDGGNGAPDSFTVTSRAGAWQGTIPPGSTLPFFPISQEGVTVTLPTTVPTKEGTCGFSRWVRICDGTTVEPGGKILMTFARYYSQMRAEYLSHGDSNGDGFCDRCDTPIDQPSVSNGAYQISTKAQLAWFMQKVNKGETSANAVLVNDIDMGGYEWTPITSTGLYYKTEGSDKGYAGTFDGAGYTISNFKITASTTEEKTYGLFGTLSGTVKNLGIRNVTYNFPNGIKDLRAAGIVGQMLPGSTVTDCFVVDSSIAPGKYIVGGVAACNYGGTIANCYTKNVTVKGDDRCGDLVSDTRGDNSETDRRGTVINCYTDASRVTGTQTGNLTSNCEAGVTADRFASGEIAYRLGQAWGQTLGKDALPTPGKAQVYYGYTTCHRDQTAPIYTNRQTTSEKPGHRFNENYICTVCELVCTHTEFAGGTCLCGKITGGYCGADEDGKNLIWTLVDGLLTISGEGAMKDFSYTEDPAPWQERCEEVTSILIEDGVTYLGIMSFPLCTNLTEVQLPDSLEGLGYSVFNKCEKLASIIIPEKVTEIPHHAFYACHGLKSVTFEGKITTIEHQAFQACTSITSITLPDSVVSIGDRAFRQTLALEEIVIPDSVTSIGIYVFYGCSALKNVTIGKNLTQMGDQVFYGCTALDTLTWLAEGVVVLGADVFANTNTPNIDLLLTYHHADEITDLVNWNGYTFKSIRVLCADGTLNHITDYTDNTDGTHGINCSTCGYVGNEVHIPQYAPKDAYTHDVTCTLCATPAVAENHIFGDDTTCTLCGYVCPHTEFADGTCLCGKITGGYCGANEDGKNVTWTLIDGVLTISGIGAMKDYELIQDLPWYNYIQEIATVVINEGVTTIGSYGFAACQAMTKVEIPDSVTSIGQGAFGLCDHLQQVTIPEQVTVISDQAFYKCIALENVTFNGQITVIGDKAFQDCTSLTEIVFPDSLTTIGEYAFRQCVKLTEVIIPDNVTYIGDCAFSKCNAVNTLLVGKSVTEIGDQAFYQCNTLKILTWLAEGVVVLGADVFANTNTPNIDLLLTYHHADEITDGVNWNGFTFKSIQVLCADGTVNHTFGYTPKGNATHEMTCTLCGYAATEACSGGEGTATCINRKVCDLCQAPYGELNPNNHAAETYTNGFLDCCGKVYEPATGSGTESDPYKIGNAGQLYWFAQQVNGGNTAIHGKLVKNILINENVLAQDGTLNEGQFRAWTPMGSYGNRYTGTFDGNGKTISGLYFNNSAASDVGLFSYVGNGGIVKNVGIQDSYVSGRSYVGGVVGYNFGTVMGCDNSGIVTATGDCVGGVAGYNKGGTITGCHNSGSVSGRSYVGGVVSYNSNGTVTDSDNAGSVSGRSYVGGVAGDNYNGTVMGCHNSGSVSSTGDNVGGVVGENNLGTVTGCDNSGSVSGSGSFAVGGVTGYNNNGGTVTGCRNSGSVSNGFTIGGVVGYSYDSTVTDSYNTGSVSGSTNVGGVVGYNSDSTVTDCYNSGTVSGNTYVGGVVGQLSSGTVTNCYYDSTVCSADAIGYNADGTVTDVLGKTTEQFASGEVAYLLSQGCTVGEGEDAVTYPGDIWGQNINGEGEKDAYPVFSDAKVYQILNCNNEPAGYSNTDSDALGHDWKDADCDTPKTCTGCGTTEGDALGHDWTDADCDTPKTCNRCGETEGEALGHSWNDATCTDPKTCSVCGETEGEALGHKLVDRICTVCNKMPLRIEMTNIDATGWNGNAIRVCEDGQLIATVTLAEDKTGDIWYYLGDPNKTYEFYWVKGDYCGGCGFAITIGDETVMIAFADVNMEYADGIRIYPACEEHDYRLVKVHEPTCDLWGYTLYVCTVCGESKEDDYVPSLGHTIAEDAVGVVTPPTCENDGYTTYECDRCGESFNALYLPALPHTLGEDGLCSVCGQPYTVPVWVAGIQIDANNLTDVLGDGTVSYDPSANVLTLNGFAYEGTDVGIYTAMSVNIVLLGENTIYTEDYGILSEATDGEITIRGTGTLTINSATVGIEMYHYGQASLVIGGSVTVSAYAEDAEGIACYSEMEEACVVLQDNAKVILGTQEAPLGEECVYVKGFTCGSFTIEDNASISGITTDEEGIYVGGDQQFIVISDNASVYFCADKEALDANTIRISGGTVTAIGGEGYEGIYADELIITGGTVTVSTVEVEDRAGDGVEADCITITGGTLKILSGGLIASMDGGETNVPGTITLGEGVVIASPAGAVLGQFDLTAIGEGMVLAVLDAEGNFADSLIIQFCVHEWADADCDTPKTCILCGATEGEPLGHSYENDVCTICGHIGVPVKLDSASLSFKEKIHYNIFFSLGLDETVDLSDMGLVMFDSLKADGTMDDAIAIYAGAVEMDGKYMVATDGVPAKYMGDTIYFRVYAKLADGSYVYSKTVEYSAVTYAEHILNSDKPESAKALVVAMLNYGAAAQMYFGYNTDNLVNAFLTDEQKALPEQYRDDMANTVPVVAAEKQGIFANNKGFNKRVPAVSFEGAFEINYFFTPAYAPVDGITLYYWTEADFEANEVLTVDNATGSLKLEGTGTEQYRGDIGGIAAKNLSENIYVAAIYSDGTTTWTSGVLGYSIGAYCGRLATNGGTIADLAMATAVYGYHAKAYFG